MQRLLCILTVNINIDCQSYIFDYLLPVGGKIYFNFSHHLIVYMNVQRTIIFCIKFPSIISSFYLITFNTFLMTLKSTFSNKVGNHFLLLGEDDEWGKKKKNPHISIELILPAASSELFNPVKSTMT